jgi:hypothetical protein
MGKERGEGNVVVFNGYTNDIIINPNAQTDIYFKLYDTDMEYYLHDLFIGHEIQIALGDDTMLPEGVDLKIHPPLFQESKLGNINQWKMFKYSTYTSKFGTLLVHFIYIYDSHLVYFYSILSINQKIIIKDMNHGRTPYIPHTNFVASFISENNTYYDNNYLHALSVVDYVPTMHVYIVSAVIGWVNKITFPDIEKNEPSKRCDS